jgi:hypothetical protein
LACIGALGDTQVSPMRTKSWLSCLLIVGMVACGDDDDGQTGEPDADIEDSGDRPREDGGQTERDSGDELEPEPDASRDSGDEPEPEPDASDPEPEPDAGVDAGEPLTLGGLTVTVEPEEHELDLFGQPGHRFWFEVSEEQMEALNQGQYGGGGGGYGDIYWPGAASNAFFADHLLIEDVVTGEVADYGKVEIDLVGGSTYRQWTPQSIPNVRVDSNEFNKDTRLGTFEHLRLNNSVIGTIFGEAMVHRVFLALDYPALRSSHVFLGGSVWGEHTWVPMTLVEMYKRRFCRDNEALLGGSCENMWEFAGDLGGDYGGGYGSQIPKEWCQVNECDNTRLVETMAALADAPRGAGFKEAMEPFIAWDLFHRFQCISWILHIGDSALQGGNNTVLIERDTDHKLIWAPYSVDISTATEWSGATPLTGVTSVAVGCQRDRECWADTIAVCEEAIMAFDELNPEEMVDELITTLTELDMMRFGDDDRGERMRTWYEKRQANLSMELEQYRYLPDDHGNCEGDMVLCGDGGCGTPEACETRQCSAGAAKCESTGSCYYPEEGDFCPECTEEAPYFCRVTDTCVPNEQVCADACEEQGNGYVWCELARQCLPAFVCELGGGGMGGIDMGGGMAIPGAIARPDP